MVVKKTNDNNAKMELSDGMSDHSEDSDLDDDEDSQSSQMSSNVGGNSCNHIKPTTINRFHGSNGSLYATLPSSHISLDGLNSGVPTRTTPTLTPTTLRNIEQTFIELQCPDAERHSNEARFVPPSVKPIGNNQYTSALDTLPPHSGNTAAAAAASAPENIYTTTTTTMMNKSVTQWHHLPHSMPSHEDCNTSDSGSSYATRPTPPVTPHRHLMMTPATLDDTTLSSPPPQQSGRGGRGGARRNVGGRKPQREANLSPEEEQRRQLRRERNKAAAARCRKRRVDHTNLLIEEVEGLESKKRDLHSELQNIRLMKEELEMILNHHHKDGSQCKASGAIRASLQQRTNTPPDIKPQLYNTPIINEERVKTEYNPEDMVDYDMDYDDDDDSSSDNHDSDLFQAPSNKRIMLTHASLPQVVTRPSRPNSLNVTAASANKSAAMDSLAGIINSTPSSGLQFNFDSLMVGGTGLTPVAGPLLPTSLHCGSQQQHLRFTTAAGSVVTSVADMMNGNVELNTPDTCATSHKFMLSL